jgi:hypothetical protein
MKFRKEYQTYLLIVIAIITAGYFLKPFFFNKKKKVVEGQVARRRRRRVNIPKIVPPRSAFNQATTGQVLVPLDQTQFTYGDLATELGIGQY